MKNKERKKEAKSYINFDSLSFCVLEERTHTHTKKRLFNGEKRKKKTGNKQTEQKSFVQIVCLMLNSDRMLQ